MTHEEILRNAVYRDGKYEVAVTLKSSVYHKVRAAIFRFDKKYQGYDQQIQEMFDAKLNELNIPFSDVKKMRTELVQIPAPVRPLTVVFENICVEFVGDCYNQLNHELWTELDTIKKEAFASKELLLIESFEYYIDRAIHKFCDTILW